jgi:hypothetical protein
MTISFNVIPSDYKERGIPVMKPKDMILLRKDESIIYPSRNRGKKTKNL